MGKSPSLQELYAIAFGLILIIISIVGLLWGSSIISLADKATQNKERVLAELEEEGKEKLKRVNAGDEPVFFDYIYLREKVSNRGDTVALVLEFEEDFKQNFSSYSTRYNKHDIFDIKREYEFKQSAHKVSGSWVHRIEVVSKLRVTYQRSFYYLGNEEYGKYLGTIEFPLTNEGRNLKLGNGTWVNIN